MPVCVVLKDPKALSLFMSAFWHIAYQLFWLSSLSAELEDVYHKSAGYIGIAYLLRSLFSIVTSFMVPCAVQRVGRTLTIYIALLFHFFAFLFLGPSLVFNMPQR